MKKLILVLICSIFVLNNRVYAEPFSMEEQDGRYVLEMMEGRAIKNTRVPAMILDTVRGIAWTCQNLQDGKPLWVKADLGKNGNKSMTGKKYIGKMLMWQDSDLRMPAIVVDTEEGIVWTCQNIIDGKALWVEMDLKSGAEKEIAREALAVIKAR
ncbi:hypothetical protein ACFL2J_02005 [Candidatus Omnitrophota bacterium]